MFLHILFVTCHLKSFIEIWTEKHYIYFALFCEGRQLYQLFSHVRFQHLSLFIDHLDEKLPELRTHSTI